MKAGDTISGYTLLQECGKGTFGKVFLAENTMGERVAFKAVSALGTYAERELQALKDYQRCSRGTHLLQIYHAELTEDYLFYVMELADQFAGNTSERYVADTLAERLKKCGKLSVKETTDILCSLLADLKILHDHGLIHRDIKPANIVFVNGEAKLGDIGLLAHDCSMTVEAGTPLYMPSPQSGIKGNSIEADLYSLAKVVYSCLSGKTPDQYPEYDFSDDCLSSGKVLLQFVNCACMPQTHFHSVEEIYAKFPFQQWVTVSEAELFALIHKNSPSKGLSRKKNTFFLWLEKNRSKHPIFTGMTFGVVTFLCAAGEIIEILLSPVISLVILPVKALLRFFRGKHISR